MSNVIDEVFSKQYLDKLPNDPLSKASDILANALAWPYNADGILQVQDCDDSNLLFCFTAQLAIRTITEDECKRLGVFMDLQSVSEGNWRSAYDAYNTLQAVYNYVVKLVQSERKMSHAEQARQLANRLIEQQRTGVFTTDQLEYAHKLLEKLRVTIAESDDISNEHKRRINAKISELKTELMNTMCRADIVLEKLFSIRLIMNSIGLPPMDTLLKLVTAVVEGVARPALQSLGFPYGNPQHTLGSNELHLDAPSGEVPLPDDR